MVIIWLMGFINLGFIISFFIAFFKSFIEGVSIGVIIKSMSLIGIGNLIISKIVDCLFIIPILVYILYKSSSRNLNKNNYFDNYQKCLYLITLFVVIYSVIKTLI